MKYILLSLLVLLAFSCNREEDGVVLSFPAKNKQRLCFVGDTGTGKGKAHMVADAIAQESCDFLVILGDVIYPNGISSSDDPQLIKKFEKPFAPVLKDPQTKIILAAGNHDNRGSLQALKDYAATKENVIFPRQFFQVRFGEKLCLNVLDTNFNFSDQKKFFRPRMKKCAHNIGASHHPYKSSGEHGDAILFIKDFLEDLVIGKMAVLFSGHDHHLSDEGSFKGTRQFISGSGAKLRELENYPAVWGESTYGYAVMDIDGTTFKALGRFMKATKNGKEPLHEFSLRL